MRAARHNLAEGQDRRRRLDDHAAGREAADQRRDGVKPRGLGAKLREMVLALRLEHRFTKREILALYLNLASYGNQTAGAGARQPALLRRRRRRC